MSFLKKIFGSPPEEYSLDKAMEIIQKDLALHESADEEDAYKTSSQVHTAFAELSQLIREFSEKEVPEFAKSSANVKERFCSLALRQISTEKPSRDSAAEYIQSCRSIINNLGGLTQRQFLHISFFFKEDFRPVAKKVSEINGLIDKKHSSSDFHKAEALYRRIKELGEQKKALHDSVSANEEKLNQLKARQLPALAKEPDNYDLNKAETKLRNVKQEIDSFLAVQKLLKKYEYVQKTNDELLAAYIESPSSALIKDEDLRIVKFIGEALALVKEGKIDTDMPEKKIEAVLNAYDYLKIKRAELAEAFHLVKEEKEKYQKAKEHFEASLHARTNELAKLEGETKHIGKLIESAKKEEVAASSELARTRAELCILASKILNANVS